MKQVTATRELYQCLVGLCAFLATLTPTLCGAANSTEAKPQSAGIKDGLGLRGAFYCRLDSGESWEQFAKVGPHADVKVRFGNPANSLIFWRASSYLPLWQTAGGQWYFDELVPRKGDGKGPRADKICQMSRVAIIKDSPARTQVLWRYLPDFSNPTLESWVEETFTVYPDGICIRAVRKGTPSLKEWMEPGNTKIQELVLAETGISPLDKSLREPAALKLSSPSSGDYEVRGIERSTRSHLLACKQPGRPGPLNFALLAGDGKTIHNPVIVVKDWGDADVQITVGGEKFTAYQIEYVRNMNIKGGDLVVWMNLASDKPAEIALTPVGGSAPMARAPVRDPYASKVPLFPEGSSDPGPFGAYYTQFKYFPVWDEPWRVGDAADIVVQFDDQTSRFVFWRGPAYVPEWANDQNHWYNNEFCERRPKDGGLKNGGCAEPMQDYDCRYSYARIISANDARVVVHWRYAPSDKKYDHQFVDQTGWGDWVDEYYTVYPDAVCVRKATLYTSGPQFFNEWHEAIPLVNPGCIPEDVLDMNALAMTDYDGNKKIYNYESGFPKKLDNLPIMLVGMKGKTRPFAIPESKYAVVDETSHPKLRFNHYDDWPAWPTSKRGTKWGKDPDNGYRTFWKTLPSHSSLMHYEWGDYAQDNGLVKSKTKIMLNGMTANEDVNSLVPLAKSWEQPPTLEISSPGFGDGSYDKSERAYRITRLAWWFPTPNKSAGMAHGVAKLEFKLQGSANSPIVNPCFVIMNWPREAKALLALDGKSIQPGPQFRQGIETSVDEVSSLIIWIKRESTTPMTVTISSDRPIDGQQAPSRK